MSWSHTSSPTHFFFFLNVNKHSSTRGMFKAWGNPTSAVLPQNSQPTNHFTCSAGIRTTENWPHHRAPNKPPLQEIQQLSPCSPAWDHKFAAFSVLWLFYSLPILCISCPNHPLFLTLPRQQQAAESSSLSAPTYSARDLSLTEGFIPHRTPCTRPSFPQPSPWSSSLTIRG